MKDTNERKQYLENLLLLIENYGTYSDNNFQELYNKVQLEFTKEEERLNSSKKNAYLYNLKQTLEKQVADYKEAEPNFKHVEYFRFLKAFREDVQDEVDRIKKYG